MNPISPYESAPLFVCEVSWEVCNMVGGIHTVLASKAAEMTAGLGEHYLVIGPKIWNRDQRESKAFLPEEFWPELLARLKQKGIAIETGRWNVPGSPRCILVDFSSSYKHKNDILETLWVDHQVDSLSGGWDYVEPVLFGYTTGRVIRHLQEELPGAFNIVAHWHEWMVGAGMLYLKTKDPEIASVFTTHATVLGRSIASSGENLLQALQAVSPGERARQQGVAAKFSLEKALALKADCFTTVSGITAEEAGAFFGRKPDLLLPNGLGDAFPDPRFTDDEAVRGAREFLFQLAEWTTGFSYPREQTLLMMSSGRYEYVNKGINLIVDALPLLEESLRDREERVLFFFMLPAGVNGPIRKILNAREGKGRPAQPLIATHELQNEEGDPLLSHLRRLQFSNDPDRKLHALFVPIYLEGDDPLVKGSYYELLAAFDLTVFPSHYEPWGYTPLESIGYGIPTVTSDLAGFGRWAASHQTGSDLACYVLPRAESNYDRSARDLAGHLHAFISAPSGERAHARAEAQKLSQSARWNHFLKFYQEAYGDAVRTRDKRFHGSVKRFKRPGPEKKPGTLPSVAAEQTSPRFPLKPFTVLNQLPQPLQRLREMAYNLWWSWHPEAEALFEGLDPALWRATGHNPVQLLETISQAHLEQASQNGEYLQSLDRVLKSQDAYLAERPLEPKQVTTAYFCMEFGLHQCLPLYSGGLGILAGDHLKQASDHGLSLVAVGLAYRLGYFTQRFDLEGHQLDEPNRLDFTSLPMSLVKAGGEPLVFKLLFPGRKLTVQVWQVRVGAIRLLLLDTDHPANTAADREITSGLYAGDREKRLQQEMVLGIGGRNILEILGYEPKHYHMNEGHASFLILSRIARVMTHGNLEFRAALEFVRQTSVFTTHTPVAAGHDVFDEDLMRPYFSIYQNIFNTSWDQIMDLGRLSEHKEDKPFSMTLLGLRGSAAVNGVSKIHEGVSKKLIAEAMPGFHVSEVPVGSITNGVHLPTWLAPGMAELFHEHMGATWWRQTLSEETLAGLRNCPDEVFRKVRLRLKSNLMALLRLHFQRVWQRRQDAPGLLAKIQARLREEALVIGFARRFAPYKRATLLFSDLEALERLVSSEKRPVVFLFAGKAHPADQQGKALAQTIFRISREERFLGKILLLENYEIGLAKALVQGCDVWMNTPTRPLEASGTSGMKAAINGGLNLSVLDGWWAEGYNGRNGWAVGSDHAYESQELQDEFDSQHLYHLLEDTVIPTFFGEDGAPGSAWLAMSKQAVISTAGAFSAARMLEAYHARYYRPAAQRAGDFSAKRYLKARQAAGFKKKLLVAWSNVSFGEARVDGLDGESVFHGQEVRIAVPLHHPQLAADDLRVQFVSGHRDVDGELKQLEILNLQPGEPSESWSETWQGTYIPRKSGPRAYGIRVVPSFPLTGGPAPDSELCLVKWL